MRQRFLALILSLSLCACLLPAASADGSRPAPPSQAQVLAEKLNTLGLLLGDENGEFHLDQALTRTQALVMLIRALGQDAPARSAAACHPFTDVPEWAEGYVSWGYAHGYTKGVSDTLFGSEVPASREMYLTFLLRALGYSEGPQGEFTYDQPYALASQAEILPAAAALSGFSRGDAAQITAAVLFAEEKSSQQTLHQRLEQAGFFTPEQFSAAFPENPFALEWEWQLRTQDAMDRHWETGLLPDGQVRAQASRLLRFQQFGDLTEALVLSVMTQQVLTQDGQLQFLTASAPTTYYLTFSNESGQVGSISPENTLWSQEDRSLASAADQALGAAVRSLSLARGEQAVFSRDADRTCTSYEQAMAALRGKMGYGSERVELDTDQCTVLRYDLGGFMLSPKNNLAFLFKAGSPLGEGTVIHSESPYPLASLAGPSELLPSEDGKRFTYLYEFSAPIQANGELLLPAGRYVYQVDLTTGVTVKTYEPLSHG